MVRLQCLLWKNHPVYLGFSDKEMAEKGMGHAVLITGIKYKSDFSKFRYMIREDIMTDYIVFRINMDILKVYIILFLYQNFK